MGKSLKFSFSARDFGGVFTARNLPELFPR